MHELYSTDARKELDAIRNEASDKTVDGEETQDTWTSSREIEAPKIAPHCKLCNKTFSFEWQLQRHVGHSALHAHALEEKEQLFAIALKKSAQLATIIQTGISIFASVRPKPSASEELASVPRMKWRAAIAKIIQQQTHERYQVFLSEMHIKTNETHTVVCLYSGSKLFWKSSEQSGIHLYHHSQHGCIEVVSQFFTSELAEHDVSYLYLSYNLLIAQTETQRNKLIRSKHSERSQGGRFEKFSRCTPGEVSTITKDALVTHVLKNLHMPEAIPIGKRSLIFTWQSPDMDPGNRYRDTKLSANEMMDPNMPKRPMGLVPVKIDTVKLHKLWQVEQAMAAVTESREQLTASVRRAESLAKLLEVTVNEFVHRMEISRTLDSQFPQESTVHKKMRRVGARVVRIVQVEKMVARLEGLEKRRNSYSWDDTNNSTDLNSLPKLSPIKGDYSNLPWIQVRPSKNGQNHSPTQGTNLLT